MDDEALTRILDAVGSKFIPANLDRDELRADVQLAAWWWMQITGQKSQPASLRRLQDIRRAAEDLKRLLEEDAQSGLALSKYPFTGSDPLTVLNQLTNDVNRVLEPLDGMRTRPGPLKGKVRLRAEAGGRHLGCSRRQRNREGGRSAYHRAAQIFCYTEGIE